MTDYAAINVVRFFQGVLKIYDFFTPEQARTRRMAEFEILRKTGELENMCSSEIHALFGIRKISNEF